MPGITNPAEEYFKDGLWAWVSTAWKKLVADASGFLQINVAAQDIDIEVKQTTPADLTPGICGWDSLAWRKLALIWGYSDRLAVNTTFTASGAGDASGAVFTVPDGEVYVIRSVAIFHDAVANKALQVFLYTGVDSLFVIHQVAAVPATYYFWSGELPMKKDDTLQVWLGAPGDGKKAYSQAWGYKMKVAE